MLEEHPPLGWALQTSKSSEMHLTAVSVDLVLAEVGEAVAV